MIKFFRKIRKRLLTENRFSKYMIYASGEIILVVIGILIALAANNWNIEQNNAKTEIKLLQQLEEEFTANLNELEKNIELRNNMNLSVYTLRDFFIDGAEGIALDSLEKHRALTYYNVNFNAPNGITTLLLNSGELNLIQDEELKTRLSNWSGNISPMIEEENFVINHLLSQYFNYTNLNYDAIQLAGEFDQMKNETLTDPLAGNNDDPNKELISEIYSSSNRELEEWTKWLNDITIRNYVLQVGTRNKIANNLADEVRDENEKILELIRSNLKK